MNRRLRRLMRRVVGPEVSAWFHPAYRLPLPAPHLAGRASPRRASDALTWALDLGVIGHREVHEAPELRWEDAERVHDTAYLGSLDRPEVIAQILAVEPDVLSPPEILGTWRRAAGATLAAARWARRHRGRAVNLGGGFHHAEAARGGGFCALNDVAIAVAALRRDGFDGPVVVIDLDAHPPDGIVSMLSDDPQVTVLSLAGASTWEVPGAAAATVIDRRLPQGCDTATYLDALSQLLDSLPPRPGLALYLAGADPLVGDPIGGLSVSEDGLRIRDRRVFRALRGVPTVVLPAGGYLEASWRVLAGTLAEAAGLSTRLRAGYDPLQYRSRQVMRTLDPAQLGGSDEDQLLSEDELFASMGIRGPSHEPRFLGFYTRHGLEHALTAYGYLPILRRLGFQGLQIHLETDNPPDRMRITANVRGQPETLVDLSVSIRPVGDWRTLYIEWLELQDPRLSFTASRPRLPGQQRPGLGLAEETMTLLVRASERLDLDGVSFVPAHYHVAWMSRGRFVVVNPQARGRMQALSSYLEGVSLLRASQLLDEPGLTCLDGSVLRWDPPEMVAPRTQPLLDWLHAPEREAEVEAARAELAAKLPPLEQVFP